MARRSVLLVLAVPALMALTAAPALACGGLVAPGHAEVLRKATTLSAWHDGLEHYVTGFRFAGTASSFGYIVPLPGVPTKIEKGGDWTLERLELEVAPFGPVALEAAGGLDRSSVEVIQQVRIDALDITVVRGGGPDVAAWADEHGFDLTPDTPEVLGAYSEAGAVFALAKFDRGAAAEEGLIEGQGTTIHFTIPAEAPWIPLRILALGKAPSEQVQADLFILTEDPPSLEPGLLGMPGVQVVRSEEASRALLADLGSDRGMEWMPSEGMWLTALRMDTPAAQVRYDLSIDGGGPAAPAPRVRTDEAGSPWWPAAVSVGVAVLLVVGSAGRGRVRPA